MAYKGLFHLGRKSLRRQLTTLALGTGMIAVGFAATGLIAYEVLWFRAQLVNRAASIGDILGSNIAAALAFDSRGDVNQSLSALVSDRSVVRAYVFNRHKQFVSSYTRSDKRREGREPAAPEETLRGVLGLAVIRPIHLDHELVGFISVESDLSILRARVVDYSSLTLLVMLLSLGVAYAASRRMQNAVFAPLRRLEIGARHVSLHRDYALRMTDGNSDEVNAVMNAFNDMLQEIQHRDRQLSERAAQLMEAKETLEKRVLERTGELQFAQHLLAQNVERLDSALEGAEEALWDWNIADRRTYYSERWSRMLGYSPDEIGESVDVWKRLVHPDDLPATSERLRSHLEGRCERYQSEYRMKAKDGGWRWIRARAKVVARAGDGSALRVTGTHVDITVNKQAEDALLKLSREAGRAEVATSVLHNVGNVLNSVNVSATISVERIRELSLHKLAAVVDLLNQHQDNLAGFLSGDPKGTRVIPYLAKLGQRLEQERQTALKELALVSDHVEHIKRIVAAQQSYAKVSGLTEKTSLAGLAEHALQIVAPGLDRNGIRLERDFEALPEVNVDKHQILQILLNLLRNAKEAIQQSGNSLRLIRLRIHRHGNDRLRIEVHDSGVGLHGEQLTRIFAHGYTTKRDGHGFGLHSGALAAKEMSGSLWAESDGPGLGATFILELPWGQVLERRPGPAPSNGTEPTRSATASIGADERT